MSANDLDRSSSTAELDIDLSSFSRELEATGRHPDIVSRIARVTGAASAHKDLSDALNAIYAMQKLIDEEQGGKRQLDASLAMQLSAYFTYALVLYTRATETDAIDRLKWFGRGKLPVDLREPHTRMMLLRDKGIAHFGRHPVKTLSPAVADALTMRLEKTAGGINNQYVYHDTRSIVRGSDVDALESLLEWAMPAAMDAFDARCDELSAELKRAASFDRSVHQKVWEHAFDAVGFYRRAGLQVPTGEDEFQFATQSDPIEGDPTS
ncbi:hypothetical protein GGQ80_002039 [Sphingomonas jinjuensis]|uniref:Uncharacterized protein n=1 Tax=Sphingomonas jinjuensis TaxID=535907 RepID=A0A840F8U6_9SPHN|nr:hypothetical protein [Sphingomonas jinjuensis]MBB4154129.1 hypothetical protein [Sphingomonas jinjuensis]